MGAEHRPAAHHGVLAAPDLDGRGGPGPHAGGGLPGHRGGARVIGARWAFARFADNIGVVAGSVFPWTSLAILIPAALALAVLVASVPALLASRAHPADALRDQ